MQDLQDAEVVNMAVDRCGSLLSDIVGTAFERTSRQSRIKHVLQDKVRFDVSNCDVFSTQVLHSRHAMDD